MIYRIAAEGILLIHFCFILFAVFGGLLVIRRRKLVYAHIPAVIWAFLVQWFQWICPLTPVEIYFRNLGGQAGYKGGFIENYLSAIIYTSAGRWFHISLAIAVVALNVFIYFFVIRKSGHISTSEND